MMRCAMLADELAMLDYQLPTYSLLENQKLVVAEEMCIEDQWCYARTGSYWETRLG